MVEYGQLSSEAGSFPGTVLPFPPRFPIWLLEFAVFLQLSLELAAKERKGKVNTILENLSWMGEMSLSYSKISLTVFVTLSVCCVCACASTHVYMGGGRGRESEAS